MIFSVPLCLCGQLFEHHLFESRAGWHHRINVDLFGDEDVHHDDARRRHQGGEDEARERARGDASARSSGYRGRKLHLQSLWS